MPGAALAAPAAGAGSRLSAVAVVAIAVLAFAPLAPFLGFDRQRGHGSGLQPLDTDLFSGLEAVAVGAILDALQCFVDLADQLAFPVTGAQLEAEFLFLGGAVVGIGKIRCLVFHVRDRA